MANDSSATARETPHGNKNIRPNTKIVQMSQTKSTNILKRQIDRSAERAIIRYALEINDPWLASNLCPCRRAKRLSIRSTSRKRPRNEHNDSNEERIEVLTELICRAGDERKPKSGRLLVLRRQMKTRRHSKSTRERVKPPAFTRCGELTLRMGRRSDSLSS